MKMPKTGNIQTAFPQIPEENLVRILAGLSPGDTIAALLDSANLAIACEGVTGWMLQNPSRALGTTLPGLWLARDQEIQTGHLPTRIGNALTRLNVNVWGDVLELTPSIMVDIRGFGQGSLEPFLAAAVRISIEACARQAPPTRVPTIDSFEVRCFPQRPNFNGAQLARLLDWVVNEMGATTLNDLFAISSQPNLPEDIRLLCEALRSTQITDLFPGVVREEPLEAMIEDLCGVLNKRSRLIFFERISLNHQRTLDDLGNQMGLTKERVRQLAVLAEERIRDALATPRFAPIGWRAHTLRNRLGTAMPRNTEHLKNAMEFIKRRTPDTDRDALLELLGISPQKVVVTGMPDTYRDPTLDFLLWLAGPYTWDSATGWLCAREIPGPDAIDAFADEQGKVDMAGLKEHLTKNGLLPDVQLVWLDLIAKVRKIEDCWLIWSGTVADKAARLLDVWGQPATPEAIVAAIGEGHDVRGARARLFEDERFMRVDMTRVGLRAWGMEEYSTIAEEIDKEIALRGGMVKMSEVVSNLAVRFGLREHSIRATASAPMFIIRDGTIRRRTDADPHEPVPPITSIAGCYLLGPEILSWRIDVNADSLRGSGRSLPASIAAWLGVLPGGRFSLTSEGVVVNVSWPETTGTGPSLGSIRSLLEKVGACVSDLSLVIIRRDERTVGVTRIDPEALNATQGIERLSLLTGLSLAEGENMFLHALGQALGTRGTRPSVKAALKERGESSLAALVPPERDSPELDAAIDTLKDLF